MENRPHGTRDKLSPDLRPSQAEPELGRDQGARTPCRRGATVPSEGTNAESRPKGARSASSSWIGGACTRPALRHEKTDSETSSCQAWNIIFSLGHPSVVGTDVVHRADVGMIQ